MVQRKKVKYKYMLLLMSSLFRIFYRAFGFGLRAGVVSPLQLIGDWKADFPGVASLYFRNGC